MTKKLKFGIAMMASGATIFAALALPTFAQTTGAGSSSVGSLRARLGANASGTAARAEAAIARAVARAGTEITNRIDALNALETRVNGMIKISGDEKSSLATSIQAQITAMTSLQSQISADQASDSTSSLKTDVQSITKAYRIYALILPQGEIAAASDRILTIADSMTTLADDLQARITAAQNAGADTSSSVSALADLNAKAAGADAQAQAAVSHTASLQPDNGVTTVMQSNTAALKQARADIQVAQKDLVAARANATAIIKAIKAAEKISVTATTTSQ